MTSGLGWAGAGDYPADSATRGAGGNSLSHLGVSNLDYAMSVGVIMGEALNEGLVGMGIVAASGLNRMEAAQRGPGRFGVSKLETASLGNAFAAPHLARDVLEGRRTEGARGARQYSTTYNSNIPGASTAAYQNFSIGAKAAKAAAVDASLVPDLGIRQSGFAKAQKALEVAVKANALGIDLGFGITNYGAKGKDGRGRDFVTKSGAGTNVASFGGHKGAPAGGYPQGVTPPNASEFAARFAAAAALTGTPIDLEDQRDITKYASPTQISHAASIVTKQAQEFLASQDIEAFPGVTYSELVQPTGFSAVDVRDVSNDLQIDPLGLGGFSRPDLAFRSDLMPSAMPEDVTSFLGAHPAFEPMEYGPQPPIGSVDYMGELAAPSSRPAIGSEMYPGLTVAHDTTLANLSSVPGLNPMMAEVVSLAAARNPGLFEVNPFTDVVRSQEQQRALVDKGWSQTMNSTHRHGNAVDLVPINPSTGLPDPNHRAGYGAIRDAMLSAAKELGVADQLKWGGAWKGFQDLPHYELKDPVWADNRAKVASPIPDEYQAFATPYTPSAPVDVEAMLRDMVGVPELPGPLSLPAADLPQVGPFAFSGANMGSLGVNPGFGAGLDFSRPELSINPFGFSTADLSSRNPTLGNMGMLPGQFDGLPWSSDATPAPIQGSTMAGFGLPGALDQGGAGYASNRSPSGLSIDVAPVRGSTMAGFEFPGLDPLNYGDVTNRSFTAGGYPAPVQDMVAQDRAQAALNGGGLLGSAQAASRPAAKGWEDYSEKVEKPAASAPRPSDLPVMDYGDEDSPREKGLMANAQAPAARSAVSTFGAPSLSTPAAPNKGVVPAERPMSMHGSFSGVKSPGAKAPGSVANCPAAPASIPMQVSVAAPSYPSPFDFSAGPVSYRDAGPWAAGGFTSLGGAFVDTAKGSWAHSGGYGFLDNAGTYYAANNDFLPDGRANYSDHRSGNYSPHLADPSYLGPINSQSLGDILGFGGWGSMFGGGWGGSLFGGQDGGGFGGGFSGGFGNDFGGWGGSEQDRQNDSDTYR